MTKIQQIEQSIEALTETEFDEFSEWFDALRQRRWESEFEFDAKAGKLDALANEALTDFKAGRTRPI